MANELKVIPLGLIRESKDALRAVDVESVKFLGLVDSIKTVGVMNPVVVRPSGEAAESYVLVDGLHRFKASQAAGKAEIPANVITMDDAELMDAQLIANLHRVDTKPAEYSKHLLRMLAHNPYLTESDLAKKLSVPVEWLKERLSLTSLNEEYHALVDNGTIPLMSAYSLAKLPKEEQPNFIDRACTEKASDFVPQAAQRIKELKAAKSQGRSPEAPKFEPQEKLQTIAVVRDEYHSGNLAKALTAGLSTAEEGFKLAIAWALHMDERSIAQQKAKWDAKQAENEEKKAKAKAEREARKKEEEAKQMADVTKL